MTGTEGTGFEQDGPDLSHLIPDQRQQEASARGLASRAADLEAALARNPQGPPSALVPPPDGLGGDGPVRETTDGSGASTDPLGGVVHPPWTWPQVESLNGYQRSMAGHPFTCPREHPWLDQRPSLLALARGWVCAARNPGGEQCPYTQDWAQGFMADGSWREADRRIRDLFGSGAADHARVAGGVLAEQGLSDAESGHAGANGDGPAEYRKKVSATVWAWQVTPDSAMAVAAWCGGSWGICRDPAHLGSARVQVPTLEGPLCAHLGDSVLQGEAGEFWPVRADRFAATYGPAEQSCGDPDAPDAGGNGRLMPIIAALADLDDAQLAMVTGLLASGVLRSGAGLIAAERQRQISAEGYTPGHDAEHGARELLRAAITYAMYAAGDGHNAADWWPWGLTDFKPGGSRVRALVKAGALIAAEIDRLGPA